VEEQQNIFKKTEKEKKQKQSKAKQLSDNGPRKRSGGRRIIEAIKTCF
jgi:hypothetical protein